MSEQRVRVKICGITCPEDARAAAVAGADAIGLVFHEPSSRYVEPLAAARIVAAVPPFVTTVGLFLNAPESTVRAVLKAVPLDLLQFHGSEDAAYCEGFGRPYIKAVAMGGNSDGLTAAVCEAYVGARGFLVDSHAPDEAGGSGRRFDWQTLRQRPEQPLILAGGLHPGNVAEAVREVRPWAVDVSSGVESAPGNKDAALMQRFVNEVRSGNSL